MMWLIQISFLSLYNSENRYQMYFLAMTIDRAFVIETKLKFLISNKHFSSMSLSAIKSISILFAAWLNDDIIDFI